MVRASSNRTRWTWPAGGVGFWGVLGEDIEDQYSTVLVLWLGSELTEVARTVTDEPNCHRAPILLLYDTRSTSYKPQS